MNSSLIDAVCVNCDWIARSTEIESLRAMTDFHTLRHRDHPVYLLYRN